MDETLDNVSGAKDGFLCHVEEGGLAQNGDGSLADLKMLAPHILSFIAWGGQLDTHRPQAMHLL